MSDAPHGSLRVAQGPPPARNGRGAAHSVPLILYQQLFGLTSCRRKSLSRKRVGDRTRTGDILIHSQKEDERNCLPDKASGEGASRFARGFAQTDPQQPPSAPVP